MKRFAKILCVTMMLAIVATMAVGLVACNDNTDNGALRFVAPEGTPALAMTRLPADNKTIGGRKINYAVISPSNIDAEMSNKLADIIIMPVDSGASLINADGTYKLVSVAVNGSLYMVGKKSDGNVITFDDLKGKTVACIGQTKVPGQVFRYVMAHSGLNLIDNGTPNENQVLVKYVADGPAARQLLAGGLADFAVVGEPAATQFKGALGLNAEMDMQAAYKNVDPERNGETYPQAGLFVRASLAADAEFMNGLFAALSESKEWVISSPADVQAFVKANLYEAAVFPSASIPRCALNVERLDDSAKNEIIAFLYNVKPTDSNGNAIDWEAAKERLF